MEGLAPGNRYSRAPGTVRSASTRAVSLSGEEGVVPVGVHPGLEAPLQLPEVHPQAQPVQLRHGHEHFRPEGVPVGRGALPGE